MLGLAPWSVMGRRRLGDEFGTAPSCVPRLNSTGRELGVVVPVGVDQGADEGDQT